MQSAIEFVRLCENLGLEQVKLKNLYYCGMPGYDESMCLQEDDPEVQDFFERLRKHNFRIRVFLPGLYGQDHKRRRCIQPFRQFTINSDGAIAPCCVVGPKNRWGNFFEELDVWNGSTMTLARRNMLDPNFVLPLMCMHCEYMILERPIIGKKESGGIRRHHT